MSIAIKQCSKILIVHKVTQQQQQPVKQNNYKEQRKIKILKVKLKTITQPPLLKWVLHRIPLNVPKVKFSISSKFGLEEQTHKETKKQSLFLKLNKSHYRCSSLY